MTGALYECRITHARTVPLRNVFSYGSYLWLVDLDRLPRPSLLASFSARDHLGDPALGIRENLDRFLAARGIDLGGGRVMMLANARALGYVFNPLTVYWCHRADGALACVVAEVHNTYGQRHAYLLRTDDRGRAQVPKEFYVSPFYPVDGRYRMSLPEPDAEPGRRLALSVVLDRPDGHSFIASVRGRAVPATAAARLVRGRRRRPDPLAGRAALPARAAGSAAARSSTSGGGSVTSTSMQTTAAPWTVDADRWPDVAVAAGSRARAAVARAVFTTAAARLPLRVKLPDGRLVGTGGPAAPVMVLRHPREFFRRFGASGLIGFGESYMAGDWDSADLTGLLTVFAAHADELVPTWLQRLRTLAVRRHPPDDLQTVQGARRNIGRHYDLSNDLFALFLDETMTYSSALFTEAGSPEAASLKPAAFPSRRPICSRRPSGARSTGCSTGPGWAPAAGCSRSAPAGASWPSGPRAGAPRCAASPSPGSSRRWPPAGSPRPGWPAGSAWNCATTATSTASSTRSARSRCSRRWASATGTPTSRPSTGTWPRAAGSGCRPSPWRTTGCWPPGTPTPGSRSTSSPAGCSRPSPGSRTAWPPPPGCGSPAREDFGAHYAETLKIWREQFGAHAAEVADLGFDEVFNRMWKFYLCYSEAGFRTGYIGVSQLTLART